MKKYIIIFIFLFTIFVIGCGKNTSYNWTNTIRDFNNKHIWFADLNNNRVITNKPKKIS